MKVVNVNGLSEHLQHDIYLGRNMLRPATIAQTAFWEFVTNPFNRIPERIAQEILSPDFRVTA
jgi:hypothetical protein